MLIDGQGAPLCESGEVGSFGVREKLGRLGTADFLDFSEFGGLLQVMIDVNRDKLSARHCHAPK